MSKKISLNPKYTNISGYSWSTTTYNNLEYHISTNKNSDSVSTLKCEFTTPYNNIDVVIEIGSSSESNYDWCYIGKLDDSNVTYNNYLDRISGRQSNNNPLFKTVTINVAKAGTHFLIIGYRKDGSGSYGNDCGYFRLITTEVESQNHSYIYCGTKKKLEPIEFSKDNNSETGFAPYTGSDKRLQWANRYAGNYNNRSSRISFMTTSDNITVTLIYERYFNANGDKFVASSIDGSLTFTKNDYVYITGAGQGVVTKEITVSKAGEHYIDIGYVLINARSYIHIGFSGSNIILNAATPESILANNKDIGEVYVGSELIWEKSKIMWFQSKSQEMTFVNNSDGNVLNGKVTIPTNTYDKFSYGNNVISGSNDYNSSAYYGIKVKDIINNGYIYLKNYQRAMDLSAFPNPVNMEYRHGWSNRVGTCMFLKINSRLEKETTSMSNMFMAFNKENYSYGFTEPLIVNHKVCNIVGLDKLNTSNITKMDKMFYYSRIVGNLDFSSWDTSKVTDISYMFDNSNGSNKTYNGSEYDIDNYSYLTGLNNWNLQSVNDMHYMFNSSTYYDYQDKELTWNTYNANDMSYMFAYAITFNFA